MNYEIWAAIKGYEGFYEVSNYGRVKSLDRVVPYSKRNKKGVMRLNGVILKDRFDGAGYKQVILMKNGIGKSITVHRLVAMAFVENKENKPHVNHLDECSSNNRYDNLQWCTHTENMNHGTRSERVRLKTTNGKLSKKVGQYNINGELVKVWPSANEARRNGFSQGNISSCCRGERKSHKNYIWKYINT